MKINYKIIASVVLLTVSLFLMPLHAAEIADKVKPTIDGVIAVLKDKSLKGAEKTNERREKIRNIIVKRFDFPEMAKRSLARYWRKRTDEERKEFVKLFSRFLENSYIDKIEKYNDEEVVYLNERIDNGRAVLKTKIITHNGADIPIEYRLLKKDDWMIYDIVIEGVSLVRNYRSQFTKIIQRSSYEALIERLRAKLKGS